MTDYRILEVVEKPYVYVDCRCAMEPATISRTIGKAFRDVMGFIQSHGLTLTGPALSVYYTYDPETVAFRAGFFVSADDAKKAEGEIKAGMTPSGRVLHFVHTGPYSELGRSYTDMMAWLEKQGLKLGAPTWEVYVDDADTTPEAELRTEIFVALD